MFIWLKKFILAGTKDVFDLIKPIYDELENKCDHLEPRYYKERFNHNTPSSLDSCFKLINECEYFLLVIDKSYGTIDTRFNKSITEVEFDKAIEFKKIIFVAIRERLYTEFNIYSNIINKNFILFEEEYLEKNRNFYAELEVYNF